MDVGDLIVSLEEKVCFVVIVFYNLDVWDGYFVECEILYGILV